MPSRTTASLFPELEIRQTHTTGLLPAQALQHFVNTHKVRSSIPIKTRQIQPASLDLRLGTTAHEVAASFLPNRKSTVLSQIETSGLARGIHDLQSPTLLRKGRVYIVPLLESLHLPRGISGKANPKSTTGRLDIFTRLITDFGAEFERVPEGYKGALYLEIAPRTFDVIVQTGVSLNQIRLVRGSIRPSDAKIAELDRVVGLVYARSREPESAVVESGLRVSVDLARTQSDHIVGFRAKANSKPIDLQKIDFYDPREYWQPVRAKDHRYLVLEPEAFYILISRERIRIPDSWAAEMVAIDPNLGEFRTHYAGFFDPGFGYGDKDLRGTCAVLEVRSHEVPFLLEDGQTIGRLLFERLISEPDRLYGKSIGSSYQEQDLKLSKHFRSHF